MQYLPILIVIWACTFLFKLALKKAINVDLGIIGHFSIFLFIASIFIGGTYKEFSMKLVGVYFFPDFLLFSLILTILWGLRMKRQ